MIDPKTAEDGAALLATAIGELMEDSAADAVQTEKGGLRVMVGKASRLKAVGGDVAALAEAMAVLARRSGAEPTD